MLNRLIVAIVIGVVVFLACLLVGLLLAGIDVPFVHTIGGFLSKWAPVIGLLAALYSFATGRTVIW